MPKRRKSSAANPPDKVILYFRDPELARAIDTIAAADAEPGVPPNRSSTIRRLLRKAVRQEGQRVAS